MIYLFVVCIILTLDQLTKMWIISSFNLFESMEIVPGFLNLVHVTNPGAAFSLLADMNSPLRHCLFLGIGTVALIGITFAYWKLRKISAIYSVSLALIAGGAAGNLIDRIRYGVVIDFLDIFVGKYHWPAFNVADSAICVGAGLFLIENFLEARNQKVRV